MPSLVQEAPTTVLVHLNVCGVHKIGICRFPTPGEVWRKTSCPFLTWLWPTKNLLGGDKKSSGKKRLLWKFQLVSNIMMQTPEDCTAFQSLGLLAPMLTVFLESAPLKSYPYRGKIPLLQSVQLGDKWQSISLSLCPLLFPVSVFSQVLVSLPHISGSLLQSFTHVQLYPHCFGSPMCSRDKL